MISIRLVVLYTIFIPMIVWVKLNSYQWCFWLVGLYRVWWGLSLPTSILYFFFYPFDKITGFLHQCLAVSKLPLVGLGYRHFLWFLFFLLCLIFHRLSQWCSEMPAVFDLSVNFSSTTGFTACHFTHRLFYFVCDIPSSNIMNWIADGAMNLFLRANTIRKADSNSDSEERPESHNGKGSVITRCSRTQ